MPSEPDARRRPAIRLGLRENAAQFTLLVLVNALVGGLVGQQQTVLPLLAEREFGLSGYAFIFSYIAAFGVTKAVANWFAGTLSDRFGRRPVLLAGWALALPVPLMLMAAPDWGWVVAANVLLGLNQGLTWSTTVVMKIDLVGPRGRGLAMGLNEAAGYGAVALTSLAAGALAETAGLRPAPFLLGLAYAVIGLVATLAFVRETRGHALHEAAERERAEASGPAPGAAPGAVAPSNRRIVADATWRDPVLSTASLAGLVNNLNFGLAWGLFPLLFAGAGLAVDQAAALFAIYPAVWGVGQLATGALSDRFGRKGFIVAGMAVQGLGLALIALGGGAAAWAAGAAVLGAGTAMVYPTLLATIGDFAHPAWRGRAVGVYRVWRDLGYAVGAVAGGVIADRLDLRAAVWAAAGLSAIVAVAALLRMAETHRPSVSGSSSP